MKKETSTMMQKMGFNDEDLKTPKHDELCLWFNQNYKQILKRNLFGDIMIHYLHRTYPSILKGYLDQNNPENLKGKELKEYERCKTEYDRISEYLLKHIEDSKLKWEYVFSKKGYILGSVDFYISLGNSDIELFIEVKPEIRSIGETIRQVNVYKDYAIQEHSHSCTPYSDYENNYDRIPTQFFVLVTTSKGKELVDLFRSQNILVLEVD